MFAQNGLVECSSDNSTKMFHSKSENFLLKVRNFFARKSEKNDFSKLFVNCPPKSSSGRVECSFDKPDN